VDIERYRRQLLDLERELSERVGNRIVEARELTDESVVGDDEIVDELKEEQFTEADIASAMLREVRAALRRIDEGTFGRCIVDGQPIEPKRLEAMPWTPYCLKHQEELEQARRPRTPTL
jgi:DnaK suppressor protein